MASDGSLRFDTKIDDSGFKSGLNRLGKVGSSALSGITKATKVVGAAMVGVGVAAAKVGMDFSEAMSRVGAISGATGGEMNKLRETAKQLGRETVFSATQAGEGMEYLAMAGFETNEIISAMPGVLNAAAAGSIDLGRAADITSNVISGFNLEAGEAGRVADVLTKTFTSSNTTMESLGDTMSYVAPIASAAGFSLEEMAAAAGIMGDAGIQGSQAGMVLRNTILRLADPPKQAADALAQLGVSATDSSGEMKPLSQIIGELDEATQGMTKAQKTAIISQIAGTQSAAGLMAIMEQGGDAVADFTKELENAGGTAEEIAAKQLDNLKGDLKLLQSALEGVGIAVYENMDAPLRASAQFLSEYMSRIAFVVETVQDFEQAMISVSAILGEMFVEAILAAADAIPKLLGLVTVFMETFLYGIQNNKEVLVRAAVEIVLSILEMYTTLIPQFLETGIQIITQLMQGIIEVIPDVMTTMSTFIQTIISVLIENLPLFLETGILLVSSIIEGLLMVLPEIVVAGFELILALVTAIMENVPLMIESAINIMNQFITSLTEALPMLFEIALQIITTLLEGISTNIPILIDAAISIMETLSQFIIENLPLILASTLEIITTIMEGISSNVDVLVDAAITIIESLSSFISDNLPRILEAALEIIMSVIEGIASNVTKLTEAAVQIIETLTKFIIDNLPLIIDAALQIILAILDGLMNNLDILIDATITIMIALVEAIISMLPQFVNSAIQIIISLANGILNSMPQVVAAIVQVLTSLVGAIVRFIPQLLALGIQLIGELAIGIAKTAATVVNAGLNVIKSVFAAMKGALSGAAQIGTDLVKGIWNGINDVTGWIMGKIKGFGSSVMKGIKGIFGIKSPSKLMRDEVGKELIFGIGVGFEDNAPDVEREMKKDLSKLGDKLSGAVELETNTSTQGISGLQQRKTRQESREFGLSTPEGITISGNEFYVRDDSDINKIARELLRLKNRRNR